jgi:hypothetical protein
VSYEPPSEELEKAFDDDPVLRKLISEREAALRKYFKEEEERAKEAEGHLEKAREIEAEQRELGRKARDLRGKAKSLLKKRPRPKTAENTRRTNRRKGIIRQELLRKYLSTQKDHFLQRWKETHSHEVSKKE